MICVLGVVSLARDVRPRSIEKVLGQLEMPANFLAAVRPIDPYPDRRSVSCRLGSVRLACHRAENVDDSPRSISAFRLAHVQIHERFGTECLGPTQLGLLSERRRGVLQTCVHSMCWGLIPNVIGPRPNLFSPSWGDSGRGTTKPRFGREDQSAVLISNAPLDEIHRWRSQQSRPRIGWPDSS